MFKSGRRCGDTENSIFINRSLGKHIPWDAPEPCGFMLGKEAKCAYVGRAFT